MTKCREILRLANLRINNTQIAASVGCTRQTVISVLRKAEQKGIGYEAALKISDRNLAALINKADKHECNTGCRTMSMYTGNSRRTV
jgi:DNA-binding Lrp family transcriptional regulator